MTDTISTLTPNLSTLGEYIQQNVLNGYRLVEGYPNSLAWQYQVVMSKAEKPVVEQPKPEARKPGRPAK